MTNRRAGKPSDPMEIMRRRNEAKITESVTAEDRATIQDEHAKRRAAARPENWGINGGALTIDAGLNVPTSANLVAELVEDERGAKFRAYRTDVFDTLFARNALTKGQFVSARRLENDIATRAGLNKQEPDIQSVDCSNGSMERFRQSQVDAGRRIDAVLHVVGPRHAMLLTALIDPMVCEGKIIVWRGVVERVTRETRAESQAAIVRSACDNLEMAYDIFDRLNTRAAA